MTTHTCDSAGRVQKIWISVAAALALAWALSSPGRIEAQSEPPAIEKISPKFRAMSARGGMLPVLILLKNQPQTDIYNRAEKRDQPRFELAMKRYRAALESRISEAQLKPLSEDLDRLTLETRQSAVREVQAAIQGDQDGLEARLKKLGATDIRRFTVVNMLRADIPASALAALEADAAIAEVSPVEIHQTNLDTSTGAIGASAFWNDTVYGNPLTGIGQSVAVIDTGVHSTHPYFAGLQIISRLFNTEALKDLNFRDEHPSVLDSHGHGTHVAGIVASHNATYPGVARGLSTLYNLKAGYLCWHPVLRTLEGCMTNVDLYNALDWLVASTAVRIVNYSYGGGVSADDDDFARYFDRMADTWNLAIVVSAGNEGFNNQAGVIVPKSLGTPGIAYNVISVANWDHGRDATGATKRIHASSSRGPTIGNRAKPDLAAPGTEINSADRAAGFTTMTGTSMAAPHVAGAVALLRQFGKQDPLPAKALLINSADRLGATQWSEQSGWGYLNLQRLRAQVNYTRLDSVETTKFYSGATGGDLNATLVWNRHFNTNQQPVINNLDLQAYRTDTGAALSGSTLKIGNVEFLRETTPANVVLKVKRVPPYQHASVELFGLAVSQPSFFSADPPYLSLACIPQVSSVNPGNQFALECTVHNTGGLTSFGTVLTIGAGTTQLATRAIGNIGAGENVVVTVDPLAINLQMTVAVKSLSFGEEFTATKTISVNPCKVQTLITPPLQHAAAASGVSGTFQVTAPSGCKWNAQSTGGDWLKIDAPLGAVFGNGTVSYHVLPNAGLPRDATININWSISTYTVAQFAVMQAGASGYSVKGRVTGRSGAGLPTQITLRHLSGPSGGPGSVSTDANGNWSAMPLATGGTFDVAPVKQGYSFLPTSRQVSSATNAVDFIGYPSFVLSGTVTLTNGGVLAGATIAFVSTTGLGAVPPAVQTDAQGRWSQSGFESGITYRITPAKTGYTFTPPSATANSATGVAFSASIPQSGLSALNLSPGSVIGGGATADNTVTLNAPAPSAGALVLLTSSNPQVAVPAVGSVVVQPGFTVSSPGFWINTFPVAASTSVTISATYGGVTKTASLAVTHATLATLTLSPTSVVGGTNTSANTVALTGVAPAGGATVMLTSSHPTVAIVPASVVIPAGAYLSQAFTITTKAVTAQTLATITATYGGISKTAQLTLKTQSSTTTPPVHTRNIGSAGSGNGQLLNPRYLAFDATGNVLVTENSRVQTFSSSGAYVNSWGVTSTQPGKIGVHPFGDVYVVNEQIEQYAADGTFIGSIGGVDQFGSPMSFAFDPMGDIYVSDMGFRLWKYWLSGYAEQIAALQYYTNQIADIAVNSVSGDIYVLDSKQSRVTRFSQDGSVLSQWETHRSATDRSVEPRGIAVDGNGNIYVSDTGKHRIQKFTKDGVFLTMWGTQGSGNGQFTSPWGIAVDPAGRIYVADYGNNRIQVFQ